MEPPEVGTVLVAVDGTDESAEAAHVAIAIADRYEAEVVNLYVHGRDVEDVQDDEAIARSETAETFLDDITETAETTGVAARTASAYGFSTHRKLTHPGSVILDAAEQLDADFLVIPRESVGEGPAEGVLARSAEYALLYASQPVLAV